VESPTASLAGASLETSPASAHEPVRVLVADDAEDNRLLLERYVRGEAIQMEFSENGQQAVDAIERGKTYDLILMDIDMPVLDGIEATKAIRTWEGRHGGARTPIVALSAHAMREAVRASLEAGCIAHVAKPVDRPTLLKTVFRYALPSRARTGDTPAVAEDVLPLIPKYLASKAAQIEEARASLSRQDFAPIQRFGHNLKGTGGGYGFPRIEDLGREIEDAARHGDGSRIAGQLDALLAFVSESSERLGVDSKVEASCSN
jgi:CheY-like chemotaxis protein/HPt (histidine-containing phosphotransfer) domain-containing protein